MVSACHTVPEPEGDITYLSAKNVRLFVEWTLKIVDFYGMVIGIFLQDEHHAGKMVLVQEPFL